MDVKIRSLRETLMQKRPEDLASAVRELQRLRAQVQRAEALAKRCHQNDRLSGKACQRSTTRHPDWRELAA